MKSGDASARNDPRAIEKVRGIFASLAKYIQAKTIYASNNPNLANFARAFHDAFRSFFQDEKELVLSIEQYRITWQEQVVYENPEKSDSIAFLFFKDGVGEITIQSTVVPAELERFVDLLGSEIYHPSSHLDIVGRLWQSEFAGIGYRVFVDSTEGAAGDTHGAGSDSREEPLQAGDHSLPPAAAVSQGPASAPGGAADSLGAYLANLVARELRNASAREIEQRLQEMLSFLFTSSAAELSSWREEHARLDDENKLLRLLSIMFDFAEMRSSPPVARDIGDIIDRMIRYIVEEAHVPTLIALLDLQRTVCRNRPFAVDFQSLPSRIEHEITNGAFLLSLGQTKGSSAENVHEVLLYFRMIGSSAVPGLCQLLKTLQEPSLRREACDALIEIAADDVPRIVNDFNLDDLREAKDAVYLLRRIQTDEIHPVAARLVASPDHQIREAAIEYIVGVGNDEAARLVCELLQDKDPGVRLKTFAAAEEFRHPLVTGKVMEACFAGDNDSKSPDELERMFRAAGKLAGEKALGQLRQMAGKGSWLRLGRGRGKQHKLLAITALRHIRGSESLELLGELSRDGDSLVRTKALYALKHADQTGPSRAGETTFAAAKDAER